MPQTSVILLAEDEPMLRELMALELRDHGYAVHAARNGSEVIAALEHEAPSMLLLDLLMPRVDGYAVLQHIRDRSLSLPVIVLSNLSDDEERQKCLRLGACDFLVKNDLEMGELPRRVAAQLQVPLRNAPAQGQ